MKYSKTRQNLLKGIRHKHFQILSQLPNPNKNKFSQIELKIKIEFDEILDTFSFIANFQETRQKSAEKYCGKK